MKRHIRGIGIIVVGLWLTAGCGFQLRGSSTLPEEVGVIHVEGADTVLADELEVYLQAAGAEITTNRQEADAVLVVDGQAFDRRLLSVDPDTGKAREYELVYVVYFRFVRTDGQVLLEQQTVNLLRDFVFDADAVMGKSREEDILRTEMQRDAAQQILRRLQAALSA